MQIRLQKFIAQCGIASRRAAEELILRGLIKINGKIEKELGTKVDPQKDIVFYKKKLTLPKTLNLVYALYKPKNCITSLKDELGRETIKNFFPKSVKSLFPVGRLDYDSEGLIFITNNGDFAQKISHPKYRCKKSYLVKVNKILSPDELKKLNKPMMVDKKLCRAKAVTLHTINQKSWLNIELYQGLNLQIKKMLAILKIRVIKIKRIQIGCIKLQELKPGGFRLLSGREVKRLLNEESFQKKLPEKIANN